MTQIALVADEHDDNVGVGVITQLLEPAEHIDVGSVLGDVVHEQSTNGSTVVAGQGSEVRQLIPSMAGLQQLTQR